MGTSSIHLHIRASVLVAWVVAWNALFGLAFWLNGGFQPVPGRPALIPASVACIATAIFAASIARSTGVQALVLRPNGDIRAIREDLWLIAFIAAALGVGLILFMSLPSNA